MINEWEKYEGKVHGIISCNSWVEILRKHETKSKVRKADVPKIRTNDL
jgi:hypothetical protein